MENRFFCVYFASVGGGRPVSRHRTLEAARRAARRQQRGLERAYPGAAAMSEAACGADAYDVFR